jgi:large subunit ribosomal protein LP1
MSIETSLSYAALILADAELDVNADNLKTLVSKANIEVEGIWLNIFANALQGQNFKDLFFNIQAGASAPAAGGAAAAGGDAAAEAVEEKEEEAAEESDDDMGMGLFD